MRDDERIKYINTTMETYLTDGTLKQAVADGYVPVSYTHLDVYKRQDKKQLRKRMKLFVSQIEKKNTDMYKCVNKNYKVFCMLNKMLSLIHI